MMIRSFLPVGQGAFYCEQFERVHSKERINVIYDCGSLTDVRLVEQQIKRTFQQNETIHALFISHLDEDHINGIPFLLKYCRVKKIFFPLITSSNAKYIKLSNSIKNDGRGSVTLQFLNNPYRAFRSWNVEEIPSLYQISDEEEGYNNIDAISISSGEDIARYIFEEEPIIEQKWLYIPYNFRRKDRIIQLQNELNVRFGKDMSNEDLYDIWENGSDTDRKNIKAAYQNVKGSLNTNSMTLYSGMEMPGGWQTLAYSSYIYTYPYHTEAGCLYTGDYDASGKYKWNDLFNAYNKFWQCIGCVQVPHHGSRHNYNTELAKLDAYYIISAGKNNKYHHPHNIVLKDLLFNGHFPHIVTENKGSEVHLLIYI